MFTMDQAIKASNTLKGGEYITCTGMMSKDGTIFMANFFETTLTQSQEKDDRLIRYYGSLKEYQQAKKELAIKRQKDGFVLVLRDKEFIWIHMDDAVEDCGKYFSKIEYCMDKLGASEVTKRIREAGISFRMMDKERSRKYKELLNKMVSEAYFA